MARPRSDIAPRIVSAARDRFLHDGVDGASLRAIAEDAGTSIGMVYYYFPTKDDLFLSVVEQTYVKMLEKMSAALESPGTVEERIDRLYRLVSRLDDEELATVRLVVREALVSSDRLSRVLDRFERGHISMVGSLLVEGLQKGEIDRARSLPVVFGATVALGVLPQLVRRIAGDRLPPGLPMDAGAMADELVHVLFHGIGPRGAEGDAPAPDGGFEAGSRTAGATERRAAPKSTKGGGVAGAEPPPLKTKRTRLPRTQ